MRFPFPSPSRARGKGSYISGPKTNFLKKQNKKYQKRKAYHFFVIFKKVNDWID